MAANLSSFTIGNVSGTTQYATADYLVTGTGNTSFTIDTGTSGSTVTIPTGTAQNANLDLGNMAQLLQQFGTLIGPLSRSIRSLSPEVLRRARRLLEGILPAEEVLRWDRDGFIEVPSRQHPGYVYRITAYRTHTRDPTAEPYIEFYCRDEKVASICVHVDGAMGLLDDALVAKYLLCRYAEEDVARNGNWTWVSAGHVDWGEVRDQPPEPVALVIG